jgi:uncharacterized protein
MTVQQLLTADEEIAGVTAVDARRIGLLGDDHNAEEDGGDLPAEALEALAGVDLILHLGHMGQRERFARGALDRLEKVAPVLGVRDFAVAQNGDPVVSPADGNRIVGVTRVIEAGGLRIGLIHNLGREPGPAIPAPPGGLPELDAGALADILPRKFGGPVDVVAYAGTHRAAALSAGSVLFVNPGSPTYPKGPGWQAGEKTLGTVGILEVHDGVATFETIGLRGFAA